jgi:hypothetical protein
MLIQRVFYIELPVHYKNKIWHYYCEHWKNYIFHHITQNPLGSMSAGVGIALIPQLSELNNTKPAPTVADTIRACGESAASDMR